MIKAVIFDMDGVLIDSVALGLQARKKLLAQYGVDLDAIPDPHGEAHRATSLKSLLASIKNHTGIHIDHDEFARTSRERMRKDLEEANISADPELIEFLQDLRRHNIVCAIVSSGLRKGIDIKLEILGIRQYFSVTVTGDDVEEHKPNPAPYLYALKKLNLTTRDCVIFEDSQTGVQAARASGCKVIGFTKYNPPNKQLTDVEATIKSWAEINYDGLENLPTNTR